MQRTPGLLRLCSPILRRLAASPVASGGSASAAMAPKRKTTAATAAGGAEGAAPPKKAARKAAAPKPPPGPLYDPATMRAGPLPEGAASIKILSWNVAGLRGLLKKNPAALSALVAAEAPDVLCLQEHKLQESHCGDALLPSLALPGGPWHAAWSCSTAEGKKGYSGTAILSRAAPLAVTYGLGSSGHEGEGRVVTAEFGSFFLVNVYVPNSGDGLKRLEYRVGSWDADFAAYVAGLEARGKAVVVAGDLNVAHTELDIHSPKTNLKSAGFTPEERASFEARLLGEAGLVDAFRARHPGVVAYTYWGYRFNARANNKGWRLDYYLVSKGLAGAVHDAFHLQDYTGSDHCPLGLVLKL